MNDKRRAPKSPENDDLDARQEYAALLLAEAAHKMGDYTAVATEVGVDRRTLYRWRCDPAFQDRVRAIANEFLKENFGRAVKAQADILENGAGAERLAAVRDVLYGISQTAQSGANPSAPRIGMPGDGDEAGN